jgi:hypothetical protein
MAPKRRFQKGVFRTARRRNIAVARFEPESHTNVIWLQQGLADIGGFHALPLCETTYVATFIINSPCVCPEPVLADVQLFYVLIITK